MPGVWFCQSAADHKYVASPSAPEARESAAREPPATRFFYPVRWRRGFAGAAPWRERVFRATTVGLSVYIVRATQAARPITREKSMRKAQAPSGSESGHRLYRGRTSGAANVFTLRRFDRRWLQPARQFDVRRRLCGRRIAADADVGCTLRLEDECGTVDAVPPIGQGSHRPGESADGAQTGRALVSERAHRRGTGWSAILWSSEATDKARKRRTHRKPSRKTSPR